MYFGRVDVRKRRFVTFEERGQIRSGQNDRIQPFTPEQFVRELLVLRALTFAALPFHGKSAVHLVDARNLFRLRTNDFNRRRQRTVEIAFNHEFRAEKRYARKPALP